MTGKPERERFERALPYHWRLVWRVGVETGLRVSDILALRRDCLGVGSFTVTEKKTKKQREVVFSPDLMHQLQEIAGYEYIFFSPVRIGQPLTRAAAWAAFKRAAKIAGVTWPVSPHSARKTCAQDMIQAGASPDDVRRFLGHSSLSVTVWYLFDDLV